MVEGLAVGHGGLGEAAECAADGAAVDSPDEALEFELVEVAADGLRRDVEVAREFSHGDFPVLRDAFEDERVPLRCVHGCSCAIRVLVLMESVRGKRKQNKRNKHKHRNGRKRGLATLQQ